jgi:hypothetical protein
LSGGSVDAVYGLRMSDDYPDFSDGNYSSNGETYYGSRPEPSPSPSFPPPPPPSPQSVNFSAGSPGQRESVSTSLAKWTYALMIAAGAAAALRGVLALAVNQSMNEFLDTFSDQSLDDFVSRANAYDNIDNVYSVLTVATFVLLIIFSSRSYKATQSLGVDRRKWSRGMSVGCWFIPFGNFYIAPSLLIETDKVSRGQRVDGVVTEQWRGLNRDNSFVAWFALYGVGLVLASLISSVDENIDDFDGISNKLVAGAIGNGLIFAGAVVGALAVKRMAARLSPSAIG